MMTETKFQAGVAKNGDKWDGVIRLGKTVTWKCGHAHNNRHETSGYNPISAYKCSSTVLEVFNRPESVKAYEQWFSGAYLTRAWQVRQCKIILNLYRWAETQRRFLTV